MTTPIFLPAFDEEPYADKLNAAILKVRDRADEAYAAATEGGTGGSNGDAGSLGGVTVSGTPSEAGDVLTATGPAGASWRPAPGRLIIAGDEAVVVSEVEDGAGVLIGYSISVPRFALVYGGNATSFPEA